MKTIDVDKQVRLSLAKTIELVVSGVQFRLFRAAITVVIIALAVAFLMTMLSESLIGKSVAAAIETKTAPRRLLGFWISQLSGTITHPGLLEELPTIEADSSRWRELRQWGALDDAQMQALVDMAGKQAVYAGFFATLDEADRRNLVGRATGREIFDALQSPDVFAHMEGELDSVGQAFPEGGVPAFSAFLDQWAALRPTLAAIIAAHTDSRSAAQNALLHNQPVVDFFTTADDSLPEALSEHGFVLAPTDVEILREQATLRRDADQVGALFSAPLIKQAVASKRRIEHANDATVEMLFELTAASDGGEWLLKRIAGIRERVEEMQAEGLDLANADPRDLTSQEQRMVAASLWVLDFDMAPDRIREVARARLDERTIDAVALKTRAAASGRGFLGFSSRTVALIGVSFIVCIVGIANAMLMSVTERFREIATMKCLGATDGFIMVNFILESCMQGVAGGIVGAILGFILGVGRSWASYGTIALTEMPVAGVLASAGLAFVLGVVISALAAVYPASAAARLAPMEAMRIE
jgi:putative ABC transport system permease protein